MSDQNKRICLGCRKRSIAPWQAVCGHCWTEVDADLRVQLLKAWDHGNGRGTLAHRDAYRQVIAHLEEKRRAKNEPAIAQEASNPAQCLVAEYYWDVALSEKEQAEVTSALTVMYLDPLKEEEDHGENDGV